MHTTPVGGNVFADLGFEPAEAAALKAESQRIISDKLAIKDSLIATDGILNLTEKLRKNLGATANSQVIIEIHPAFARDTAEGYRALYWSRLSGRTTFMTSSVLSAPAPKACKQS